MSRHAIALLVVSTALLINAIVWFSWETKRGQRWSRKPTPPWFAGSRWTLQWAIATCSLVAAAAACAFLAAPRDARPRRKFAAPRPFRGARVAGGGLVVSVFLVLVLCRVVSLHVVAVGRAPPGKAESWARWTGAADLNGDGTSGAARQSKVGSRRRQV